MLPASCGSGRSWGDFQSRVINGFQEGTVVTSKLMGGLVVAFLLLAPAGCVKKGTHNRTLQELSSVQTDHEELTREYETELTRRDEREARLREQLAGLQAEANGLVDALGYMHDAVDELKRRIQAPEIRVVAYHREREWRANLYSSTTPPPAKLGLAERLGLDQSPGFLYLWWPGGLAPSTQLPAGVGEPAP